MVKIKEAMVEPLKMGRVKSTGEIRAAECRVIIVYENNRRDFHHVNTRKGGIYEAYQFASDLILKNMQQRGVI
jgi:hypothetical protein